MEPPPGYLAIAERCETIVHRILHALNARDFSASTWEFIPYEFTVETWAVLEPEHENSKEMFLHQWLESVQQFARARPDYHFEISDLATTVDEEAGTAETILNVKLLEGFPTSCTGSRDTHSIFILSVN